MPMTNKTTSAIDLVERLRIIRGTQFTPIENALVTEAADTITRLQAALTEARTVLKNMCPMRLFTDAESQIADIIDAALSVGGE